MDDDDALLSIRVRTDDDIDACAAIARTVRETDGYPAFLPGDDFTSFITPSNALGAWVATLGPGIVGHVAVRTSSAPAAMEFAVSTLGVEAASLAFVSRLMVVPHARRRGVARELLRTAAASIHELGRVAVLDVLVADIAAIALYRAEGWMQLGVTQFTSRAGQAFDEVVFLAPVPNGTARS